MYLRLEKEFEILKEVMLKEHDFIVTYEKRIGMFYTK